MYVSMEIETSGPMETVRAFPFLRHLAPEELVSLGAQRLERPAGEPLYLQGSPGDAVYGILTGRVRVMRQAASGGEHCLMLAGAGDLLAAVAAIRRVAMPDSAIPLEATAFVRIGAEPFRQLLLRHPEVSMRVLDECARRLLESDDARLELATQEVPARIAHILLRLACRFASARGSELIFTQPLTRQNLADLAGTTVESAIRVMSRWTREGLVRSTDSRITILDRHALERIATS